MKKIVSYSLFFILILFISYFSVYYIFRIYPQNTNSNTGGVLLHKNITNNILNQSGINNEINSNIITNTGSNNQKNAEADDFLDQNKYRNELTFKIKNSSLMNELELPVSIWGSKEDLIHNSYIASNYGWEEEIEQKSEPVGTNNTIWGGAMYSKTIDNSFKFANIEIILNEIQKNNYNIVDDAYYYFGYEGPPVLNVSLLKKLKKYGISNLNKTDLVSEITTSYSQPEKKIYTTKFLKNKNGNIIGIGSACSFSQDPEATITFNHYCIITYNGKIVKQYNYDIPKHFNINIPWPNNYIKSKFEYGLDREKYYKSDFYIETTNYGIKHFNNLYSSNKQFSDYIDKLEYFAIINY